MEGDVFVVSLVPEVAEVIGCYLTVRAISPKVH